MTMFTGTSPVVSSEFGLRPQSREQWLMSAPIPKQRYHACPYRTCQDIAQQAQQLAPSCIQEKVSDALKWGDCFHRNSKEEKVLRIFSSVH